MRSRPPAALFEEGTRIRDTLHYSAQALIARGLIPEERIAGFRNITGYKNVALDLLEWTALFEDVWPVVEGKAALTREELVTAKAIGERLVRAIGEKEQGPVVQAEGARLRRQAATLLLNAYDEVRRALGFLRWRQGDADTIAPSLYAGRGGRKRTAPEGEDEGDRPANGPVPGGGAFFD